MKSIVSFVFSISICLLIYPLNSYSQDKCPLNIEDVKEDSRLQKASDGAEIDYFFIDPKDKIEARCKYHANGRLKLERQYFYENKEIKYHGTTKMYYPSGKLEYESLYIKNRAEGIAKIYHEDGWLEFETPHKQDKIEGIAKAYYENGKLRYEYSYKAGKKEGVQKGYDEDGRLIQEISYENDLKKGLMKSYRENGNFFVTITYRNGLPDSGYCHHTDGRISLLTNAELTNWENGLSITCD